MRRALLIGWGLSLMGCGAAPKAPTKATTAASVAAVEPERRPYAELATERKPVELDGIWLRAASPAKTFHELPILLQGVPPLAQLKLLVEGRAGLLPADVAAVVDAAQPAELLFSMGSTWDESPPPVTEAPSLVWSFRVRSPEAIERGAAGLTLQRSAPGVWNVGGVDADIEEPEYAEASEGDDDDEDGDAAGEDEDLLRPFLPRRCQLHHLPAPVGYRILCSTSAEEVDAAAPFLLSPARAVAQTSDVHLELGGSNYAKFLQQMSRAMHRDDPAADTAAARGGRHLAQSLFDPLLAHERLSLDFSLNQLKAQLEVDLTYAELPNAPAFSQWLGHSSKAMLPPGYARLPPDSGLALGLSLGSGLAPFIVEQLAETMEEETLATPAERQEQLESLRGVLPRDGRISLGIGMEVPALLDALDSPAVHLADAADRPLGAIAVRQLQAAAGGWVIIGFEEQPAPFLEAVRRMYRTGRTKTKRRPGHEEKNPRSHSHLARLSGAPRGLPQQTLHIVNEVRPARAYTAPVDGTSPPILPYDEHYLVVPDGERVWIIVTRSEALGVEQARGLLARSAAARAASPPSASDSVAVLASATQLAFFGLADLDVDSKTERAAARRRLAGINRAPGQARLQVPLIVQVLPRKDAPGYHLHLRSSAQLDELFAQVTGLIPQAD
jgi:hypothetical protein